MLGSNKTAFASTYGAPEDYATENLQAISLTKLHRENQSPSPVAPKTDLERDLDQQHGRPQGPSVAEGSGGSSASPSIGRIHPQTYFTRNSSLEKMNTIGMKSRSDLRRDMIVQESNTASHEKLPLPQTQKTDFSRLPDLLAIVSSGRTTDSVESSDERLIRGEMHTAEPRH